MTDKTNVAPVSVIVPVYNVADCLERCLDSVLGQTLRNIEVLLVDDGSTDESGAMCDRCAERDSRVRVFHKENGGLSDARNYGIERAKGDYLLFVDSDDYITPDAAEYLLSLITKHGVKLSASANTIIQPSGRVEPYGEFDGDEKLTSKDAMTRILYDEGLTVSAWAKLYHKSLFETVRYPVGKAFEDAGTTYSLIMQCDCIALGGKSTYYYVRRADSIVTSGFKESKLDMLEMTDNMCDAVDARWPELAKATLRRRVYARFSTINQMLDTDRLPERRREMVDYVKRNSSAVMSDPRAPKRDKLALRLLGLGFGCYRLFWKLYTKAFK